MQIDKYRKVKTYDHDKWWSGTEEDMRYLFWEFMDNISFKVGVRVTLDIRVLVEHKGEKND
jgi:hypothetical protein